MDVSHSYVREFELGDLGQDTPSHVANKGRGGVFPQFFMASERDEAASLAKGKSVFREIEMVRILIPGDRNSAPERRVAEYHRETWPKQYGAFKKQQELAPDGTLIDNWSILSRSQVLDLKSNNIFTVEQLADLSDEQLGVIGLGARMLRNQAKAYLEAAETGRVPVALVAENQELKDKISLLTNQISEMAKTMERLMTKAGENPVDGANPVTQARIVAMQAAGVDSSIDVPGNYTSLGLPKLKELVAQIAPNMNVRNKDEALELIAEYLGKKAAVTA